MAAGGRGRGRGAQRLDRARIESYCLDKPGAWLDDPFGHDHVVKVGPKIFAFLTAPLSERDPGHRGHAVGLKAAPSRYEADEWLLRYPDDASPMAYIGRFGWNTLWVGGAIPDEEILEAIDLSYEAVIARLSKAQRPHR